MPLITYDAASRYLSLGYRINGMTGLPETCYAASTRAVDDCRADVLLAVQGIPQERGDRSASTSSQRVSSTARHSIVMEVVRLANHVPLPDTTAAIACGSCSSLLSYQVARAFEVFSHCVFFFLGLLLMIMHMIMHTRNAHGFLLAPALLWAQGPRRTAFRSWLY